jgi:hypothetical protein
MASASWLTPLARPRRPVPRGRDPDVRGLHQYYKDLADRFAEVGVDAVSIDFFARTASKRARLAECHSQWLTLPTGEG